MVDQQLRRNDCGISAVKTICNLLGVRMDRGVIEDEIYLDQEGASLHGMQAFLKKYNFETRYKLLDINALKGNEDEVSPLFPCITPVKARNGLHYVVLEQFSGGKFTVLDPAKARSYKWTIAEFKKKAYYSSSLLQYTDLEDVLRINVREELDKYAITLPARPDRTELLKIFNKLAYFGYIEENYGFKNAVAARGFLQDLLSNQDLTHLPWHFESLNQKREKIQVRAPVLLTVQRTKQTREVAETSTNPYWRLFKSIGGFRELWFIFLVTAILVSLISYVGVFVDQLLIDHILPSYDLDVLRLFIIGMGVFFLIDKVFYIYRKFVSIHLSNALDRYFLSKFDDKLNGFSVRYLQSYKRGDLTERLSDSMRLKRFFVRYFSSIMVNLMVAVVSTVFLFFLNWQLTLFVLGILVLFVALFYIFTPIIERLERMRFAKKAEFFSNFIEKIDGIQVIRAMGIESFSSGQIRQGVDELIDIQTKARYVSLTNSILTSFITSFATLTLIWFTSRELILHNTLTLGMIITFLALSSKIFSAFSSLLDRNLSLQEHKVILNRYFDFDEHKRPAPVPGETAVVPASATVPETSLIRDFHIETIRLEGVGFAYNDENYVFQNLDLTINKGDKIWIRGRNGSGKSTLCKVLSLLYAPTAGQLSVNDLSLGMYAQTRLRQKVLFVSGEDLIFNESILFNIAFGRQVDMKLVVEYAKVLNIYEFINKKPDKFNYILHENGRNLSTGQRKKILLLRALLAPAEVVILDEIFNGMDDASKKRAELLIDFLPDRAFLIISHMPVEGVRFDREFTLHGGVLHPTDPEG